MWVFLSPNRKYSVGFGRGLYSSLVLAVHKIPLLCLASAGLVLDEVEDSGSKTPWVTSLPQLFPEI